MTHELWDFEDGELLDLTGGSLSLEIPSFGIGSFSRLDYCQWCGRVVMRRTVLDDPSVVWHANHIGCPSCCRKHHQWWSPRFPIECFPQNEPEMPIQILVLEFLVNFPETLEVNQDVNSLPRSDYQTHSPAEGSPDGTLRFGQDTLPAYSR